VEVEVQAELTINDAQLRDEADDFRALFTAYYPFVVRLILRIVQERQAAEDLAQDVFLQFYYADRSAIENIPAWLTKASIYASYNYIRSEKRRQSRHEREAVRSAIASPSAEETWMEQEAIEAVHDVLKELDERERTLLLMKYSGFTYADLAKAAGVEVSSVGTLLARAKSRFRKLYKRTRGEEE
jgi:RNA polymerase sigma factor (sigma-70 family)